MIVGKSRWIPIFGIAVWALLASQHFFYAVGLGDAQRALDGPAYAQVRHAIDDVMRRNLPGLYVATLVSTIVLILRGGPGRAWFVVALLGLLVDATVMLTFSVPINETIRAWTASAPPADWEVHRTAWLEVLRWRQIAIASGFLALLLGAVREPQD
jgi:hypothetical protein